jgi:outer membrane biosynthesis protein TonB
MVAAALGLGLAVLTISPGPVAAQDEISRKVKSKVQPTYPELAKRMHISGTVKLQIVVAPNGVVKSA